MKRKDLNDLEKYWNKKLKESGFRDIEAGGISFKRYNHQPFFTDELFRPRDKHGEIHHGITDPSKFEKYQLIGVYAHNCKTLDPLIAKILQYYANGLSIKKSIIKVGIYTYKQKTITLKALELVISNFLKNNMTNIINFYNTLQEEDNE